MKYFLENDKLKIGINQKGAELANIQSDKMEYLWLADPNFWGRHSCILFPYIGKVFNNKYKIDKTIYEGGQHGFARNMNFEVDSIDKTQAIFKLEYNDETLKAYPYQFCLFVKYVLEENKLRIIYEVENRDKQSIYFSLGAHPGFNIPLHENEKRSDYFLKFEKDEWTPSLNITDGFIDGTSRDVFGGRNIIPITDNLFEQDALIFKNLNSKFLHLVNAQGRKIWKFNIEGFQYLGIWSKNKKSPFVCIEPWMGVADKLNANWDFRNKEGVIELEAGKTFSCEHGVEIVMS